MTKEQVIGWDEAMNSGGFITLESDETKVIKITNWKLEKIDKFGKEQVELVADTIEEDGEVVEKKFTTTSNRLKKKLRPILEGKDPTSVIKLSLIKVGDKFDTQYSVKELSK